MNYLDEIQMVQDLKDALHTEYKLLVFFGLALIVGFVIYKLGDHYQWKAKWTVFMVLFVPIGCYIVSTITLVIDENELNDQKNALVFEMINQDNPSTVVAVSDIINTTELKSKKYCRKLEDNEKCFLVEFTSDSEMHYVFIGLNKNKKFPNKDISFKIIDLTQAEKDAFRESKSSTISHYIEGDKLTRHALPVFAVDNWTFAELIE